MPPIDRDDASADSDAQADSNGPRDSVFDDSDDPAIPKETSPDDTDVLSLGQSELRKLFNLGGTHEAQLESDHGERGASIHESDSGSPEGSASGGPDESGSEVPVATQEPPPPVIDALQDMLAAAPDAAVEESSLESPAGAASDVADQPIPPTGEPSDPLLAMTSSGPSSGPAARTVTRTPQAAPDRSFLLIIFLATYAVTTTAALLYLYLRVRGMGGSGQLESLPDIKPLKDNRVQFYRPGALLPPHHSLALGEKVRFGNIEVEPIRVTSGPVAFEHFTHDATKERAPTSSVLKLWVRLTNVSSDQTIAPLDDTLLFTRSLSQDGEVVANNFVCRRSDQAAGRPLVLLYDLPPASEWSLEGVAVDQNLAPGESIETFLPTTEEGWSDLEGELVWRLHLRKGFGPEGNGVTTLVEIRFSSADIEEQDRA